MRNIARSPALIVGAEHRVEGPGGLLENHDPALDHRDHDVPHHIRKRDDGLARGKDEARLDLVGLTNEGRDQVAEDRRDPGSDGLAEAPEFAAAVPRRPRPAGWRCR